MQYVALLSYLPSSRNISVGKDMALLVGADAFICRFSWCSALSKHTYTSGRAREERYH